MKTHFRSYYYTKLHFRVKEGFRFIITQHQTNELFSQNTNIPGEFHVLIQDKRIPQRDQARHLAQ